MIVAARDSGVDDGGSCGDSETLCATQVGVHFAGVKALEEVDLELRRNEVLGLIGPNGAGKSTMVNVLTGLQPISKGRVFLRGQEVTHWPPERRARYGIGRSFQAGRLYGGLTVYENVLTAAVAVGQSRKEARRITWELLDRLDMRSRASLIASGLSHGQERILGLLRALATGPTFLLLDEPAAGLDEQECANLVVALREIERDYNVGMLVIEHDMSVIMRLCDRIQVLDHGRTIAVGAPSDVQGDPEVIRAYLGDRESDAAHG